MKFEIRDYQKSTLRLVLADMSRHVIYSVNLEFPEVTRAAFAVSLSMLNFATPFV